MRFWSAVSVALISFLLSEGVLADDSLSFQYTRNDISILRSAIPPQLPWQREAINPEVIFDIEVRDAATVYNQNIRNSQTGWFNLSAPEAHRGVMVMFKTPQIFPLSRSTDFSPLDVVVIDDTGTISQIVPNVKLSELDHEIVPEKPALAFLFLQGGLTGKLSINKGDKLDSPFFKKSSLLVDRDKFRVLKPSAGSQMLPNAAPPPRPLVPDITPQLKNLFMDKQVSKIKN
jgi:hypothetical protein